MSIIHQVLFFAFVHAALLLPGYMIVTNIGILRKHRGIELSFAYLVSIALFAALATGSYVFKVSPVFAQGIFWFLIIGSLLLFIYQKSYLDLIQEKLPLIGVLLASSFSLAFIGLSLTGAPKYIPDPQPRADSNYSDGQVKVLNVAQTPANDNYIPYRQAQFFINRSDPGKDSFIDEWGVHFFQRTPLMGAVTAQFFNGFNDRPPVAYTWSTVSQDADHTFKKFQIIAQSLNMLFIIPAFYLVRYLFDRRTAKIAMWFIVPSQFFLYNSFFSWPKSLVAFFILLSWLLILNKRFSYLVLAGIASGLAFLTHDLAVLYLAASFLLLLYQRRFRDSIVLTAITALFALPWMLISAVLYKKPSSFVLYPLSIHDIPQPARRHEIIKEFFSTSPFRLIAIRIESLFYLLSPYQLIYSEGGQALARRLWAFGIFSIPGSIGLGLILPTVLGAIKRIKNLTLWILALVPIIMSVVVIGWPKGLGALHFAEASTVLFVGLGVWWLANRKRSIWLLLAFLVNTAQLVFFVLYSYRFQQANWLNHFSDTLQVGYLVLVVLVCAWGIKLALKEPLLKKQTN